MSNLCVSLFGTCGDSKWRDPFMERFSAEGIEFFNPVVEDWTEECMEIEADHLANDRVIVIPITDETYGTVSLTEVGFTVAQAAMNPDRQYIIMVDPKVNRSSKCVSNPDIANESDKLRKMVLKHLAKVDLANVTVAENLSEALDAACLLYKQQ